MRVEEISIENIEMLDNIRLAKPSDSGLGELMNSIRQQGLLQPVGVRKNNGTYTLIWGFRRVNAYKKLGYKKIDAVIFEDEEQELTETDFIILNATENIHRKDINAVELGRTCDLLRTQGLSYGEISARLNIPLTRMRGCLELYRRLPIEYAKDVVVYGSNTTTKKGKVGLNVAQAIIRRKGTTKDERKKIFKWVREGDRAQADLNILFTLLKSGVPLKRAMKDVDNYRPIEVKMVVRRDLFEKIMEDGEHPVDFLKREIGKVFPSLVL